MVVINRSILQYWRLQETVGNNRSTLLGTPGNGGKQEVNSAGDSRKQWVTTGQFNW